MNAKYDRKRLCGNDVTAQEQERLVRLMEEAAEVQQACAKVLRWGWERVNPTVPVKKQETNREYLGRELDDFMAMAARIEQSLR
jgi:NTP pyrophosphatase (non-canonical NTP hydrolase)